MWAGEMTQQEKGTCHMSDDLNSSPEPHPAGEN